MIKTLKINTIIAWICIGVYWAIAYCLDEPAAFIYSAVLVAYSIYLSFIVIGILKNNSNIFQNAFVHSLIKSSKKAIMATTKRETHHSVELFLLPLLFRLGIALIYLKKFHTQIYRLLKRLST